MSPLARLPRGLCELHHHDPPATGAQAIARAADVYSLGEFPNADRFARQNNSRKALAEGKVAQRGRYSARLLLRSPAYLDRFQHVLMAIEKACEHIEHELSVGAGHRCRDRSRSAMRQDDPILCKETRKLLH